MPEKAHLSVAEKARRIVDAAGGNYSACLDWLNTMTVLSVSLEELIQEWREVGCEYSA